jgi:hypothetical protein
MQSTEGSRLTESARPLESHVAELRPPGKRAPRGEADAFSSTRAILAQSLLVAIWGAMMTVAAVRVSEALAPAAHSRRFILATTAGLVLLCALPTLLTFCLALVAQSSLGPRLGFEVPRHAVGEEDEGALAWLAAAARERAARTWRYEANQVRLARGRFVTHAGAYGFVSSMTLLVCLILIVRDLASHGVEQTTSRGGAAVAVGAAVSVAFAADLSRMLVRAAHRDASAQMLAWATKRLLVTITATIVFCMLAFAGELDNVAVFKRGIGGVLLGAAVAVLGERITRALTDRAAGALGVSLQVPGALDPFAEINGLEYDDRLRLAEEGIDSVHALALASTPKLFFGTPYPLARVCDWQDQALLITRVGAARARLFREQLTITGAIEAARLAAQVLEGALEPAQREAIVTVLGFGNDAQATVSFRKLATDEAIATLRAYRGATPPPVAPG